MYHSVASYAAFVWVYALAMCILHASVEEEHC